MNNIVLLVLLTCTIASFSDTVNGARILGIYNYPSQSHHVLGSTLLKELTKQGHEVVMLSPYPLKNPPKNYVDIPLPELTRFKEDVEYLDFSTGGFFEKSYKLYNMVKSATNVTLHSEAVTKLLNSPNEKFDLVIMECFMNEALLGIAHHFQAPVISMSTSGSMVINTYITDNPVPYAYVPSMDLGYSDRMSFMERVLNTISSFMGDLMVQYVMPMEQDELMRQIMPEAPHVKVLTKNISLVFLNSHYSIETARPHVPQMIPIGGFHVADNKPLPKDIQEFLDSASEGVVFFSLGSNLKSSNLPEEKLRAFLNDFSKLKQKVLFKWEDEQMKGQPKNVKIGKWLPQNDILAHPNVKAFVTHGGLLSTIEAVYHGVPLVGIPFFGDQKSNVQISASQGYAIALHLDDITEDALKNAIDEVISNPKYRQTVERKSRLIRDQPLKPLQNAVFWVEHVLRHKGAGHLRTAAQHLSWYQLLLLDVLGFLLICGAIVFSAIVLICKISFRCCKCILRMFCSGNCCVSKCVFGKFCGKSKNVISDEKCLKQKKKTQ